MKTSALVLALLTGTVQTVGWVECCCVLICKHRNDPCSDCKKKQQAPVAADCCKKSHPSAPASVPEKRCAHVEPSSEVVVQAAALPSVDLDLVLDLPLLPVVQAPPEFAGALAPSCEIRGSPPLHLLCSVLLI
jgi:hypothetical protein